MYTGEVKDSATPLSKLFRVETEYITFPDPVVQAPALKFEQFMQLPYELRRTVLKHALASDKPILPHLCDKHGEDGKPKFHDDNATDHASVSKLTSLTRVSKQLRKESLPLFYSANAFAVGPDTVTYFVYLDSMGRFSHVRHVTFVTAVRAPKYAAWVLRCVSQFDEEVEMHELDDFEPLEHALSNLTLQDGSLQTAVSGAKVGDQVGKKPLTAVELENHPRYHVGGISDLNLAILLRMLSTASPSESKFRRRIMLPVVGASTFSVDYGLRWLRTVAEGLGMELLFVERPNAVALDYRMVMFEWDRKCQGKDTVTVSGPGCELGEDVMKRALEMFPDLEEMRRPRVTCYYRTSCHSPLITWYDLETMGGGQW